MLTRQRVLVIAFCVATSIMVGTGCGIPTSAAETMTPVSTPETPTVALLPSSTPTIPPVSPNEERYEARGSPVSLLASYFNAINRREYRRAWEYWENSPNPSFEDFMQGYAETVSVFLAVSPPTFIEGAAGSLYTSIPALMVATHTDGSRHAFVGCYVVRRANPGAGAVDEEWSLYSATVHATPNNTTDATLLIQACEVQE
jgi:hypothetical protein